MDANTEPLPHFQVVARLHDGYLIEDLATAIEDVSAAVRGTGRSGTVTVSISIKKAENLERGLSITSAVKRTLPPAAPRGAVLYIDENGLHASDPLQKGLPFSRVEAPAPAIIRTSVEPELAAGGD